MPDAPARPGQHGRGRCCHNRAHERHGRHELARYDRRKWSSPWLGSLIPWALPWKVRGAMNLIHASLCPPAHMVAERLPQCGSFRKVAHAKECGIPAECTALCRAPRMTSPRRTLTHLHESALSLEGTPAPLGCRSSRPGRHFASTQWPPEPFRKCPALNAWTSDPGRKAFRLNSVAEAPSRKAFRLDSVVSRPVPEAPSAQRVDFGPLPGGISPQQRAPETLPGKPLGLTTFTKNPFGKGFRLNSVAKIPSQKAFRLNSVDRELLPEGIQVQLG